MDSDIEGTYPLTPAQEGLLFLTFAAGQPRAFVEQRATVYRGRLDVGCLRRAWQRVVDRHTVLRTVFTWNPGEQASQVARRGAALAWRDEDWRERPAAEREKALGSFLAADRGQPFDVGQSPLLRMALIRTADDEHQCVWSFHPILLDGWSAANLRREVAACYDAFVRGAEPELPPVSSYRNYVGWLLGKDSTEAEAFWRRLLDGFVAPARLEGVDPAAREAGIQEEHLELPEAMAVALRSLAQERQLRLGTVFRAAWALILGRRCGEHDVLFGAVFSGRPPTMAGIDSMVGLFATPLPLRVCLAEGDTFLAGVGRLQEIEAEIRVYQHAPLAQGRIWSGLLRGTPLFESLVTFEGDSPDEAPCAGLPEDSAAGISFWAQAGYPLHLRINTGNRLRLSLSYELSRFDPATILSLLQQIPTILDQVVARPDVPLDRLSLVAPEAHAVLPDQSEWLAREDYPPVATSFVSWAARSPQAPALSQHERTMTYVELEARVRAVALALRARGCQNGEVVALDGRPGFGLIASLLGTLLAGGVALMLDRRLPVDRQRLMCREAGAKHLVRLSGEEDRGDWWAERSWGALLSVDLASAQLKQPPDVAEMVTLPGLGGDDAAYVFFTSGTTGVPKGVLGTHRGLSHFLAWQRTTFGVGPGDRSSQLTGLSFDVVLREIFLPLTSGATLCLPDDPEELGAERVLPWLERERITTLHTVPTLADTWLLAPPEGVSLGSLKRVFFAGEPLGGPLVQRWRAAFGTSAQIVNLYGPTETTLAKCFYLVPDEPGEGVQPVGRPLPQSQALVLADGGRPCGVGEWGEIVIRTPYRTRGYVNVPEENARRFRPNPVRPDEGDLLYHTGDRGRFRADGILEISGRLDDQVKVRGARVEPGEIAAILDQHPAVRRSVVLGQRGADGTIRLVAYVVAEGGGPSAALELKGFLGTRLPEYMVPSAFVFLERMPLTPNGKVDRKALAATAVPETASRADLAPPRSATEKVVAAIWAEVLGVESVGVEENFFDLGGNSLLATRVASRVRRTLGVELAVRDVFSALTVAQLARRIEALRASSEGVPAGPPLLAEPNRGTAEVSFSQLQQWLLDQVQSGSAAYVIPVAFRIRGPLQMGPLERGLAAVVARHESLRTTFASVDGYPVQIVAERVRVPLAVVDLGNAPERLGTLMGEEARRGFDLGSGPLFRTVLYRLEPEEHALLLLTHHIVSDAWSMDVLARELGVFYAAFSSGRSPSLPSLPVQYRDFAHWHREWLRDDVLVRGLERERARLLGAQAVLELPTDRPRPSVETHRGAQYSFAVARDLTHELGKLARREGSTLFMVLLAAFDVLLWRYTGQEDLLVGTPTANRGRAELEGMVGLFVNTLVLRSNLSGDPTVHELLERVREACLDAYAQQDLPFQRLVEDLRPERDPSRNPLFQVMLVQDPAPRPPGLPGLEVTPLEVDRGASQVDLTLFVQETAEGLWATFEYATDLFDEATIARMSGHLLTVLEAFVRSGQRHLSDLPLMTEGELAEQRGWNATGRVFGGDARLHRLIEEQVARTPRRTALVHEGQERSYEELNRGANRLARRLREAGVGPEVLVGVCAERSFEMVTSLVAILKAGGAYVPLDPSYPRERLAHVLEDTGAPVVLAQRHLAVRLPDGARVMWLDGGSADDGADDEDLVESAGEDNLAYVIFTSGSTGRPKGAMNTHRAICNRLLWMQEQYGLDASDRVLQKTTFGFDVSVWEFFWPLLTGASLVLARPEGQKDSAYLVRLIGEERITTVHFVPSMLRVFLEEPHVAECRSLKRVICSGEALPHELQEWFFERLPGVELHNLYGPTEAAVDVTHWACRRGDGRSTVPIGRPVANTSMWALDAGLRPVPIGVPGELYIGGVQVGRGYYGRADLTAERFMPDPFSEEPAARLYRTGDLAKWLPDGQLECLGRIDHQVKVRGFRIELGEIETALRECPGVGEAVVVTQEATGGDRRLVAFLVPEPAGAPPMTSLRAQLGQRLPAYMVPSAFALLDSLPLTPNGKVDRKALAKMDGGTVLPSAEHVAPRTPTEEILAGIWAEVLRLDRVGADEDFFELGGHSLLAMQVVSRVRRTFGVELPVRELFGATTVTRLASRLEELRVSPGQAAAGPALHSEPLRGPTEVSFSQQRLWFLDQVEVRGSVYVIPHGLRIRGSLDVGALERALGALVTRHESLRTTFSSVEGLPVQLVGEPFVPTLPVVELGEEPGRVGTSMTEEAHRGFDLARGPLFRAVLYRLGSDEHVLLLLAHHIVSDAWSIGVMVDELGALYDAFESGRAPSLPTLPVQYRDFVRWHREWLQGEVLARQLEYWRSHLSGAPLVLELPTDRPRLPVESHRGAEYSFGIPREVSAELVALARREGTTVFMALLAAFEVLLWRYTGQEDLLVGTPVAGRIRAELEGLIGLFVNTLVLRGDLSGNPTVRELLGRVREASLGAYAHQDIPFEALVEELRPERDLSRNPLFQVMIVLQNTPVRPRALPRLTLTPAEMDRGASHVDLTLYLQETSEGLRGTFEYATDLFEGETIARMAGHYCKVLEGLAGGAEQRIAALSLLTDGERQQLLVDWNRTVLPIDDDLRIHRLFEAQVARSPESEALVVGVERFSYSQLNRRANQLARHLRGLGVGPEVSVGICMDRSAEMIVSMLGVLKAGGAYVPLDPAYPRDRVAFMLEDSRATVLLTRSTLQDSLSSSGVTRVCVDSDWSAIARCDESNLADGASPTNLAYVIYTSGSTGVPKGVAIEHRSAGTLLHWARSVFSAEERSGILASTSICFDLSVFEVFLPLAWGGRVLLAANALELSGLPARNEVTLLNTVPSAATELVRAGALPRSVRTVCLAGEPLSTRLVNELYATGHVRRVYDLYGPSEGTTYSTFALRQADAPPTIGRPIANTQAYVLDPRLEPVPIGVVGELYLGGDGLARGYLHRPELTAERFVDNPFSGRRGDRMYRTGDLARYRPDGNLEFLGRTDHQVKVRGFRIELGEIEAALRTCVGVEEAVLMAQDTAGGDRRLIAFLVRERAGAAAVGSLRATLGQRLPAYMVPSSYVFLDALPLTPNGKVDRKALAKMDGGAIVPHADHVAPRTSTEERIASIWAEILHTPSLGIHDNFFDVGGHSLSAARIIARLRSTFHVDVGLRSLFERPTIAGLSEVLDLLVVSRDDHGSEAASAEHEEFEV